MKVGRPATWKINSDSYGKPISYQGKRVCLATVTAPREILISEQLSASPFTPWEGVGRSGLPAGTPGELRCWYLCSLRLEIVWQPGANQHPTRRLRASELHPRREHVAGRPGHITRLLQGRAETEARVWGLPELPPPPRPRLLPLAPEEGGGRSGAGPGVGGAGAGAES